MRQSSANTNGWLLNSQECFVLIDSKMLYTRSGPTGSNKIACVRPERFDNSSQVLKPLQSSAKHRSKCPGSVSSAMVTVTPASRQLCGGRDKVCRWLVLTLQCQRNEAGADAGAGTADVQRVCVYRPNQQLSGQCQSVVGRCKLNYRVK